MSTVVTWKALFQSTRPVKGATCQRHRGCGLRGVSIHAPREGRDLGISMDFLSENAFQSTRPVKGATCPPTSMLTYSSVSIHAPREGRDPLCRKHYAKRQRFQSTRPVKGATSCAWRRNEPPLSFNPRAP